jgi:DNA invertase Pin-like site-specific DNA recombinase
MIFGYARVSTKEQNIDTQKKQLEQLGCKKIYIDKASGKSLDRPELQNLINTLRTKDVLIITKFDRLARSLRDLIYLLDRFSKIQIKLKIGELNFDFSTPEGRFIANIFGAVSEFERELIRGRTMEGLKNARAEGRIGGKPKGLSEEAKEKAKIAYELRQKKLTVNQLLRATGIKSKRTLYKYIRYHAKKLSEERNLKLKPNGLEIIKDNPER